MTSLSTVVYIVVALIVRWPLVGRLLPRPARESALAETAHPIDETHHHRTPAEALAVDGGRPTRDPGDRTL